MNRLRLRLPCARSLGFPGFGREDTKLIPKNNRGFLDFQLVDEMIKLLMWLNQDSDIIGERSYAWILISTLDILGVAIE
jgi:hypothetical protein